MEEKAADLIEAIQHGDTRRVAALLKSGVDPNVRDDQGWSPLHWAAQEGRTAIVERLLNSGALVDAADREGFSPLMLAVGEGKTPVVRELISRGAAVNQRCPANSGGTPLHLAAAWNRTAIAMDLITSGADINAEDLAHRTPLYFALMHGHKSLARLLIEASPMIDLNRIDSEEHRSILDLADQLKDRKLLELVKAKGR